MDLIGQGLTLMAVGMLVVFAFLALLVAIMRGSSAFFRKYAHLFPEPEPVKPKAAARPSDEADIAAVLAVVKAYSD